VLAQASLACALIVKASMAVRTMTVGLAPFFSSRPAAHCAR
jgi:hypothetical protein